MGMDSELGIFGQEQDNYKSQAEPIYTFKRLDNGKFSSVKFCCTYETGYDYLYLRICLINLKKMYMYKLEYDYEKVDDWVEYEIIFDLNDAVNKITSSKDCDEIDVGLFTCICSDKDCTKHSNYYGFTIEKSTVLNPICEFICQCLNKDCIPKYSRTNKQKLTTKQLDTVLNSTNDPKPTFVQLYKIIVHNSTNEQKAEQHYKIIDNNPANEQTAISEQYYKIIVNNPANEHETAASKQHNLNSANEHEASEHIYKIIIKIPTNEQEAATSKHIYEIIIQNSANEQNLAAQPNEITVLNPANEIIVQKSTSHTTNEQNTISEQLKDLQNLLNQIPNIVVEIISKLQSELEIESFDELSTKLNKPC